MSSRIRQTPKKRHFVRQNQPRINERGIGVFRSVAEGELDPILGALEITFGKQAGIRLRGRGQERPPAVTELELVETRMQKPIGRVAVADALDAMYKGVRTLRQRHEVTLDNTRLFRGRDGLPKVVAMLLSEEDQMRILAERQAILATLETLTPDQPIDVGFNWLNITPHVSLSRVSTNTNEDHIGAALKQVRDFLPMTVQLERATLFNPVADKIPLPERSLISD